ncbi:MAG: AAA family ATPase, partial [Phycisphaerae bacterium]
TSEFFSKIPQLADDDQKIKPAEEQNITLTLKKEGVKAGVHREYYQFRGREYAKQLLSLPQYDHTVFRRVGSIFWYTEDRTATSLTPEDLNGKVLKLELDILRRRLSDWMNFHNRVKDKKYTLKPGQKDLFASLERAFKTVFPARHFEGPVPRSEIDEVLEEPWFFLFDGKRQYEISEMSGGERTTFPMLFDFANWNIHNSVILVDELELHLHPPMQQAILRAMQDLGENNQFIVTTHSDAVTAVVPENAIVRLED